MRHIYRGLRYQGYAHLRINKCFSLSLSLCSIKNQPNAPIKPYQAVLILTDKRPSGAAIESYELEKEEKEELMENMNANTESSNFPTYYSSTSINYMKVGFIPKKFLFTLQNIETHQPSPSFLFLIPSSYSFFLLYSFLLLLPSLLLLYFLLLLKIQTGEKERPPTSPNNLPFRSE